MLQRFVRTRFQVLFHSPPGVLFTVPSRYLFTIGHLGVLSLTGWSPQIQAGFHGPGPTWDDVRESSELRVPGCYRLRPTFPGRSASRTISDSLTDRQISLVGPTTPPTQRLPAWHAEGLGSSAFAHHYSRSRDFFLFLKVLRCFSSPRWLYPPYVFRRE